MGMATSMRCQAVRDELETFVLGDVSASRAEELESHLGSCPSCREAEAEYRQLLSRLRAERAPGAAPRAEFAAALGGAIERAMAAERRGRRWRRLAAGAAAAARLAALAAVLIGRGRAPAARAPEQWRYGQVQAAPASAADGVVVHGPTMYLLRAGAGGPRVAAVDAASGRTRWEAAGECVGYLAADERRVYCLASAGRGALALAALDAATGRELWRHELPWPHPLREPSRPVPLADGRVCWSANGALHVLDAQTGERLWSRPVAEGRLLSCAVPSGDALYAVGPCAIHCFDGESGAERWQHRFDDSPGRGRPLLAIDGGRAYVARPRSGGRADVFCLDLTTRSLLWRRAAPEARFLLAAGGAVCLRGGPLTALDAATGAVLWTRRAEGCGPLSFFDGRIHYVDSGDSGRLAALDPLTGQAAWELSGYRSCDAFARVGGLGLIKTRDGVVHALALARARF